MENNSYMESNGGFDYQPNCLERQESVQEHMGLLNSDSTAVNGLSGLLTADSSLKMAGTPTKDTPLEEIRVDLGGGHQLQIKCEQPVKLKNVISKIAMEGRRTGDLLLTYLDGGNDLITINNDEQMEHYLQVPERPNLRVEQLK